MNKNLLGKFIHLKKLCSEFYHFQMLAVDQRPPIFKIISAAKKRKHSYKEVVECKNLISSNLSPLASATLLDPHYSIPNILKHNKSKGLIITLEDHEFRETKKGRYSKNIKNWTVEKIKKVGGDAVKVLAWYRPDSEKKSLVHQKKYIQKIGDECERYSIPFLLELLVYPFQNDVNYTTEYSEQHQKKTNFVIESVKEFAKDKYKVDIFKLESPVSSSQLKNNITKKTKKAFNDLGKATKNKPWVMLSSGMSKVSFYNCLKLAYKNGASGYLAGRTIWLDAFNEYPNINKVKHKLKNDSVNFIKKLNYLTEHNAQSLETYFDKGFKVNRSGSFTNNYRGF